MTALRKDTGGVRGIVSGEVIRRLTARTIAQQISPAVKAATAPFQYALSTRAGCECIAHALQALCELDQEATVTSIDGISAYDSTSRRAMLLGLAQVEGGSAVLPFVHLFHSAPLSYLWEDDGGVVRSIQQGEGGEQGDAFMPLLFCVGQHSGFGSGAPDRVGAVYSAVQESLQAHAGIRVHGGKTHVWNQAGLKPDACETLQRIAQVSDLDAQVWRGSEVPTTMQGMKVLGTPLGHPDYVASHLEAMTRKHGVLLESIPNVVDVQCAWLLLVHCASARAKITICGSVFAQSSESQWMVEGSQQGTQPRCLCHWVDLACAAHREVP